MLAGVIGLALGGAGGRNTQRQRQKAIDKPRPALASQNAPAREAVASGTGPRVDIQGDRLPEGAVSRLGTLRFNHGGRLNSLFFSPDGKTIVSEGSGNIRLWDAASGKELRKISIGESTWDDQTVFLPDGKRNDSPARRYHRYHSSMEPD